MSQRQCVHRLGTHTHSLEAGAQTLVSHWLQACGGRPMPERGDLPGRSLKRWLANLAVLEIETTRFRVASFGVALIRRFGREATGAHTDELAADIAQQLDAVLNTTIRSAAPVAACSAVPLGRATAWFCDVALPLARPAGGPGAILFYSCQTREA